MFPNYSFEPERGLVVHLVVGIHVAVVAVDDQVHVSYVSISNFNHVTEAEAASTWRHMLSWSLPSSFLQFKTGVRMPLTSSVKELGGILQKLIKIDHFINLE
jgi:hypothetical protein